MSVEIDHPSEHEQRVWLAQQQEPERVMRHAVALRLAGAVDVDRVAVAIGSLVRSLPDLNVRYRFSDEGELQKLREADSSPSLEITRADSPDQAIALVLARQAMPWVSESDPPFTALLVRCERDTVLALLSHRILDERHSLEAIVKALESFSPFEGTFTLQRFAAAGQDDALVDIVLAEFREALDSATLGADDDFFDHGGHSLVGTRIIGRLLTNHGIEIHLNDLFAHPTAASLARRAARTVAPAAKPVAESGSLRAPLSLAQTALWQAYAAFGFGSIFNIPFGLDFLDPVDEAVFERAFTDILARHAGLRTLFIAEGEDVHQQVVPVEDLPRFKWFWSSRESEGASRHSEAAHAFDLAQELPLRLRFLIDPASGRQVLSFLFHHIVLDEWSVNLMMDDFLIAYRARAAGEAPVWRSQPPPFHEFAQRQRAEGVHERHLAYWTDMLHSSSPTLPIVAEAQARPITSPAGGWVEIKLRPDEVEGLYTTARENGASLFNVIYAAIATAMQKRGAWSDLVIGTSASGRNDSAFFDTVGYFTTLAGHRVRFVPGLTVGALIQSVKNTINDSLAHSDVPIDRVEQALGLQPGRERLFELFVQIHAKNKLNGTLQGPDGKSIEFRQVDPEKHESLLGLQFEVLEETIRGERQIRLMMSYRSDRYGPEHVELLRTRTHRVIAQFARAGASQAPLSQVLPADA